MRKKTIKSLIPRKKIKYCKEKIKTYQETKQIILRLFTQSIRRPSTILISIIQPLIWLIIFSALFYKAPLQLFENKITNYKEFLNPGIIIFTAFNSSINAGLTVIFDREFGFLNRILISPISNKKSIMYGSIIHTWTITIIQIIGITNIALHKNTTFNFSNIIISLIVISIITISISNLSIYSAFILPGHIEFIGITTIFFNTPTLFTSTALAPLSFMPQWLQIICCINPLTYGIEIIRNINSNNIFSLKQLIINTSYLLINGYQGFTILLVTNIISFILVKNMLNYKYDKN
uniref:ABC transmembrane type-2 domain-containing protein n=1 Tax=Erythrocystis saccata TaxID=2822695 RepID=A0A8E6KZZ2_9FLOR|nr:hypothetical protein [Erythrocystis saccata]